MNVQTMPRSRLMLEPLEEPPSAQQLAELQTRIGQLEREQAQLRDEMASREAASPPPTPKPERSTVSLGNVAYD